MGLIEYTFFNSDFIHTISHGTGFGVVRQAISGGIIQFGPGDFFGNGRQQGIRPFQIMILQWRFIDLRNKYRLIFAVRLDRIEMFGTFRKG